MTVSHDSETPAHGQQVFSVCAFVHHDFDGTKKLFLPRRADTKKFWPGVYELPGGHVDWGETFVDALIREVQEEFAMTINVGDPYYVFTYDNHIKGSHSVEIVYFATFTEPIEKITFEPEDHSEYKWLSEAELPEIYGIGGKDENNPEVLAMRRGFELLNGRGYLDFG
ncbi:MAG TPA: NUDIX hydrolase [Candidatus Saccharimonadales bacterium]|nr:NUDIX hydrolase [Candidatus Saccharimonadales bacterium]